MKKYNIVYYSRTGIVKKAALRLKELLGEDADIEEIIDHVDRKGFLGALKSIKGPLTNNITNIDPIKNKPSDYKEIIIVTAIWGGKVTDAVRTYIATYKSDIRSLTLVTCGGGQEGDSTAKDIFLRFALKAKLLISLKKKEVLSGAMDEKLKRILEGDNNEESAEK